MKNVKRILIPLFVFVFLLTSLILGACQKKETPREEGQETKTGEQKTEPKGKRLQEVYEILPDAGLETGETPVFQLPEDTRTFAGEGDGVTKEFTIGQPGSAPTEIKSVTVDGKEVTDFSYDPNTGELELTTPPKEGETIEVKTGTEIETPPETSDVPETSEPTPSNTEPATSAPTWTGAPETPIIPFNPPRDSEDDG